LASSILLKDSSSAASKAALWFSYSFLTPSSIFLSSCFYLVAFIALSFAFSFSFSAFYFILALDIFVLRLVSCLAIFALVFIASFFFAFLSGFPGACGGTGVLAAFFWASAAAF